MERLRIKNWDQFQHYKDRAPPWIKLHTSLLDDYEFTNLPDVQKTHLVLIWLFASKYDGWIPNDAKFLRNKLGTTERIDLVALVASGFLITEHVASDALADSNQDDSGALALTRAGARSASASASASSPPDARARELAPPGLDPVAWARWEAYRVEIRKPIKPASLLAAQRKLAGFGADQAVVVENSIANGWQGLFQPDESGARGARVKGKPAPLSAVDRVRQATGVDLRNVLRPLSTTGDPPLPALPGTCANG
jgi:hypothetical protein